MDGGFYGCLLSGVFTFFFFTLIFFLLSSHVGDVVLGRFVLYPLGYKICIRSYSMRSENDVLHLSFGCFWSCLEMQRQMKQLGLFRLSRDDAFELLQWEHTQMKIQHPFLSFWISTEAPAC